MAVPDHIEFSVCSNQHSITRFTFLSNRDGAAKKTCVLKLDLSGRFAVNVVDNIIVVHHQTSKVWDVLFTDDDCTFICKKIECNFDFNKVLCYLDSFF